MSRRKPKEKKEVIYGRFYCGQFKRRAVAIYVIGPFDESRYDCLVFDQHDPDGIVPRLMFARDLAEPVAVKMAPAALRSAVANHYKDPFARKARN